MKRIVPILLIVSLIVVIIFGVLLLSSRRLKPDEISKIISIRYIYNGEEDATDYNPFTYFYGYTGGEKGKKVVSYNIEITNNSSKYTVRNITQSGNYDKKVVLAMDFEECLFEGADIIIVPGSTSYDKNYCIVEDRISNREIFEALKNCPNQIYFTIKGHKYEVIGEWIDGSQDSYSLSS